MEKPPKNAEKLHCEICNFKCSKQSDWDRHIITRKHQNRTNENIIHSKNAIKFTCGYCNKNYNARNSLWYHENKCKPVKMKEPDMSNKIEKLMADNQTILNFVTEQYQKTNKLLQMHMCHNATVDPPVVL